MAKHPRLPWSCHRRLPQHLREIMKTDLDRRFTGTRTLYGADFLAPSAHVFVIGVGGVGSWAAEALARTAVGEITLIDMDVLAESNINRQLPALTDSLGESKIEVMAQRILGINPACRVHLHDEFLTPDNVRDLLPDRHTAKTAKENGRPIIVLDCVDDMNAKLAIALHCRFHKIKLIVSGGAGGKINPSHIQCSDLKDCTQDPLLAKLRSKLRERGINRELKEKFGIKCVYSTEPMKNTAQSCEAKLACQGYGSSVVVTSTIAMHMVAQALALLSPK